MDYPITKEAMQMLFNEMTKPGFDNDLTFKKGQVVKKTNSEENDIHSNDTLGVVVGGVRLPDSSTEAYLVLFGENSSYKNVFVVGYRLADANYEFSAGDKVNYYKINGENIDWENGIIKSISEDKKTAFVVFKCNDDWENYQNYTGNSVAINSLFPKWVTN